MTSSIGPRHMGQCCTARLHVMQQHKWRHGMNSCVIGWRTSAASQSVKGTAEYAMSGVPERDGAGQERLSAHALETDLAQVRVAIGAAIRRRCRPPLTLHHSDWVQSK
jgi:hypothetical protein